METKFGHWPQDVTDGWAASRFHGPLGLTSEPQFLSNKTALLLLLVVIDGTEHDGHQSVSNFFSTFSIPSEYPGEALGSTSCIHFRKDPVKQWTWRTRKNGGTGEDLGLWRGGAAEKLRKPVAIGEASRFADAVYPVKPQKSMQVTELSTKWSSYMQWSCTMAS